MEERQLIILKIFANWSASCREEFIKRWSNDEVKKHQQDLKEQALSAYKHLQKHDFMAEPDLNRDAKKKFFSIAKPFFMYWLHYGTNMYELIDEKVTRHTIQWQRINNAINDSSSIEGLLNNLEEGSQEWTLVVDELQDQNYCSLVQVLLDIEKKEYMENFGEEKVYEQIGRMYAKSYFSDILKPQGRPPKKYSNIDTYRAFQFYRIVQSINSELIAESLTKTNAKEVCELTFGENNILTNFDQRDDINWALNVYFKLENVSVRSFLNSISRGKKKLKQRGSWD